jgi:glycyl-tRNA synthetase beta chain
MTDFLLELLCEEIPARMQEKASADLVRLFEGELAKAGLKAARIDGFVTPRRLALIARGLPAATEAVSEELKGPRADAPEQALAGFLGKTGLTREQLVEREDAKGNKVLFAVIDKPGRPTPDVLAEAVPNIIRAFPWPKSMRWGAASASSESLRWVRPLQGIVALFGEEVVDFELTYGNISRDTEGNMNVMPFEIAGVASGAATVGHRFHHPGVITIGSARDYVEKLEACHVIVDSEARRRIVREGAQAAAAAAGLALVPDEGLVAENAGLTEWPVPLLGRFDPDFLTVPREVIQLTMRTNQKYFACVDGAGALAPAFVCTANIVAADSGRAIVEGNAKVLAARLSDARFFWEQDLKIPLAEQAKKLDQIVFHEKLGTVADKVERVAKLARWLVDEGIVGGGSNPTLSANPFPGSSSFPREGGGPDAAPDLGSRLRGSTEMADLAEQAARLAKADLVTGMVGEFPELQGVMGGYYARAEGLPDAVADAIRDHYKPVGQGDEVPTAPVTVAVSLADKLDTLTGFFFADERPSGSRDPFALRRAAIAILATIFANGLRLKLIPAMMEAGTPHIAKRISNIDEILRNKILDSYKTSDPNFDRIEDLNAWRGKLQDDEGFALLVLGAYQSFVTPELDFFADRLKVQQREAGVRHDLIDAVFALGGEDDLVRLLARVKALQAFVETDDGANLLAGYRRAANILRAEAKKDGAEPRPFSAFTYEPDAAEAVLAQVLDTQLPVAEQAIVKEDFAAAMTALSVIRPTIDAFFDDVTVNSQDETKRLTRLALLDKLRAAMQKVADFSKIEG